jgi:NAD(P)-dependent dehydrogenase (short-subunit alcohol dehydrogenase family)
VIEGQVAIVTGGGRGIGRAIALALAAEGAWVAPVARTRADVEAVAGESARLAGRALAYVADATDETQVQNMVEAVLAEFGRLDILVNNVGLGLRKPFIQTTPAEWETMWRMNLWPAVLCSQAVLAPMLAQGWGHIINIASRAGREGEADMAAYSASIAGLVALTQALASELAGSGVRVNAVCPGPVDTERMQRANPNLDRAAWLQPAEVAQAVVFLVQSGAPALNGAVLDLF